MSSATPFRPRLEILPASQRRIWEELGDVPSEFVLYGGTALALRLGHRQSVDFDFFCQNRFRPDALISQMKVLEEAEIVQQAPDTLTVLVHRDQPVKLSFFGLPGLARLLPPDIAPGNRLQIASLLYLAGTKASVVLQRSEAKDYLDIDAILSDGAVDLAAALRAARAIFGDRFNPLITLKALSFFDDGDLRLLPAATKRRLTRAVRSVDPSGPSP